MSHKLLFLDQFGYFGGGQRVLLETLGSLDRAQYQTIVALGAAGEFNERLLDLGIPVRDLPLGDYHSGRKTLSDMVRFCFRSIYCTLVLTRWVVEHRPSLLFANGPRTFVCVTLAGCLTRRPVIWHLHNVLTKGVELALISVLSHWVHTILVCSQAVAEPLLQRAPRLKTKVKVVYNPVPRLTPCRAADVQQLRERFGLKPDSVCFGIFGRITSFKGQAIFLQASRQILQHTDQARFFVVGSPTNQGEDRDYYGLLQGLIKQSGMKDSVFLIEHQTQVEKYLELMDVVVVASQGPEALPQILMEAMSLGKAVIAPASGGTLEMIEDGRTGLLAEQATPNQLAAAMLRLIRNPSMRTSLGRSARGEILRHGSREKFAEAIQITLKHCLDDKGL